MKTTNKTRNAVIPQIFGWIGNAWITQQTAGKVTLSVSRAKSRILRLAILALVALVTAPALSRADLLMTSWYPGRITRYNETTGSYLGAIFLTNSAGAQIQSADGIVFGLDHNLYVADSVGGEILVFNGQTYAFQGFFATNGLSGYLGMTVGPDGNFYVANGGPNIAVLDGHTGSLLRQFGTTQLSSPASLKYGPDGKLYVADSTAGVLRFDGLTGAYLGVFIPPNNFSPNVGAWDLIFNADGNLYVSDASNNRVLLFNGTTGLQMGQPLSGCGLVVSDGLAFAPDGKLYIVSNNYTGGGTPGVIRFDTTTGACDQFATGGVSPGWLPQRVVFTPPLRVNVRSSEVGLEISWNSVSNVTYRVDYTSSLTPSSWTPFTNCISAIGPTTSVFDKISVGAPQRFYRVVATICVPNP